MGNYSRRRRRAQPRHPLVPERFIGRAASFRRWSLSRLQIRDPNEHRSSLEEDPHWLPEALSRSQQNEASSNRYQRFGLCDGLAWRSCLRPTRETLGMDETRGVRARSGSRRSLLARGTPRPGRSLAEIQLTIRETSVRSALAISNASGYKEKPEMALGQSIVTPVNESDLTEAEKRIASERKDIRIP